MSVSTNAISFVRAGATPNAEGHFIEEIYTDADSTVVDTQITAVDSNGTFTGGTFNGVVCKYAKKYIACTVNNVLNDATTAIIDPGTITTIFGTAPAVLGTQTTMPLVNGANNHNVPVMGGYALATGLSGAGTITGFSGGALLVAEQGSGRLTIVNLTGQDITFANQSASSVAANRIITATGADVVMTANGSAEILYDLTNSRWILLYVTA